MKEILNEWKKYLVKEQEEDYKGEHTAPDPESGAPLWDLRGVYPDDVYAYKAAQYYGTGEPYDYEAFSIVHRCKGRRDQQITIYRAVPKDIKAKINVGDWVTIIRQYAKDHGESALRGNYKIISKLVNARDIFTNGDSIHEWGYYPQPRVPYSERDPSWEKWPGKKSEV